MMILRRWCTEDLLFGTQKSKWQLEKDEFSRAISLTAHFRMISEVESLLDHLSLKQGKGGKTFSLFFCLSKKTEVCCCLSLSLSTLHPLTPPGHHLPQTCSFLNYYYYINYIIYYINYVIFWLNLIINEGNYFFNVQSGTHWEIGKPPATPAVVIQWMVVRAPRS